MFIVVPAGPVQQGRIIRRFGVAGVVMRNTTKPGDKSGNDDLKMIMNRGVVDPVPACRIRGTIRPLRARTAPVCPGKQSRV